MVSAPCYRGRNNADIRDFFSLKYESYYIILLFKVLQQIHMLIVALFTIAQGRDNQNAQELNKWHVVQ